MERKKVILGYIAVLVLSVAAVLPFFGRGFIPTHDGEFHFIRFAEFYRMISQGYLFPRWAPTLNSGYGIPVFEFLYPFSNYLASLLHLLGVGFVDSFKYGSAIGYIAAVSFCFLWLRRRFGLFAAVVGSVVSAYIPYWFVELFVRGEIGEVWALAALFAALYFIESGSPLLLCISVSVLILSHNILAMLFFPFLIVYILWRKNTKWLIILLGSMAFAAWFWIPALAESKYMSGLNTVNFRDHFASIPELLIPSWGTDFSASAESGNKMSLQIGIIPLIWILYGLIVVFTYKLKHQFKRELGGVLAVIMLAIIMTLPWSLVIWRAIPLVQFTQYPWRFLAYLIPLIAYLVALICSVSKKRWIGIVLAIVAVLASFGYTRGAIYQPRNDAYYLSKPNFTQGTSSMGNSLSTVWTPWKQGKPASMITDTDGNAIGHSTLKNKYLNKSYSVNLDKQSDVRINILYFPGWKATVDGQSTVIDYKKSGTLDIHIPAGNHTITVLMAETPVRMFADIISGISLVSLIGWGILRYRSGKRI